MTELEKAQLEQISHDVFGDGMKLMVVNPNELTLLKENASEGSEQSERGKAWPVILTI